MDFTISCCVTGLGRGQTVTDPRCYITVSAEQHSVGMLLTEHNAPLMQCKNVLPNQTGMCAHAGAKSRDRAFLLTKWENTIYTRGSCDLNA